MRPKAVHAGWRRLTAKRLQAALAGNVCILGVGNRLRGDDGAGSWLIARLAGKTGALCIDGGVAPENFAEHIVRLRPDVVLLVDAADFGGRPGELRLFEAGQIQGGGFSSHAPSLAMLCQYWTAAARIRVVGLGIQPRQAEAGSGLSRPVAKTLNTLAALLSGMLAPPRGSTS